MPVAIITDSACDLGASQALALGVDLVPTKVRFGETLYRDGVDLSLAEFYRRLDPSVELPVTEPPDEAAFAAAFGRHVNSGKDVVCITVSARVSQTFARASAAAAAFGARVSVVDGKTLSGGSGLLVSGAARLARAGADAAAIRAALAKWIGTQNGYAIYPDLKFLAKSGRINKAQLLLGTVMHVFPVTRVGRDGTLEGEATVKSWDQAKEMLVSIATRKLVRPPSSRVFITHTNSPEQADVAAAELRKKLTAPLKELTIYPAGPTIGANVGPGSLGVFMLEE